MSGKTGIQWTDETVNVATGCSRVHKPNGQSGCDHCYAFTWHDRIYAQVEKGQRPSAPAQYRVPFSATYHNQGVQLLPERLGDLLRMKTPRKVFLGSMTDMFHETIPDDYLIRVWGALAATPHLTYQILTKRPERMAAFINGVDQTAIKVAGAQLIAAQPAATRRRIEKGLARIWRWPLPNVWLGTSVEDQQAADMRLPALLQTPAAVRFLSCEPLLGPVDLIGDPGDGVYGPIWQKRAVQQRTDYGSGVEWDVELESGIDWVIIGGESGKHARVMNPAWALALIEQCRSAGLAVFMKQLGSELAYLYSLKDRHGGDMEAWPPDFDKFRVREFPQTSQTTARADMAVTP